MTDLPKRNFKVDWCKKHYETWQTHLKPWADSRDEGIEYLEIGVFEGRSACYMFDNILNDQSRATLVDDWRHYRQLGSQNWNKIVEGDGGGLQARAARNLTKYADRISWRDGTSWEVLAELLSEGQKFDMIYIDGGHAAWMAWMDTSIAWHLLSVGGLLIWDDANMRGVRQVVRGFRTAMRLRHRIVYKTKRQVCITKKR